MALFIQSPHSDDAGAIHFSLGLPIPVGPGVRQHGRGEEEVGLDAEAASGLVCIVTIMTVLERYVILKIAQVAAAGPGYSVTISYDT